MISLEIFFYNYLIKHRVIFWFDFLSCGFYSSDAMSFSGFKRIQKSFLLDSTFNFILKRIPYKECDPGIFTRSLKVHIK